MTEAAGNTSKAFKNARISFDGKLLIAETGVISRCWQWTGKGFLTQSLIHHPTGSRWQSIVSKVKADWMLPVCEVENPDAEITGVNLYESDDQGFTSKHLAGEIEIRYPGLKLAVKFVVWCYHDVPGIRTQIFVKGLPGFSWDTDSHKSETTEKSLKTARLNRGWRRLDMLPFSFTDSHRRYFGYQSDLQNRNDTFAEMLKEHSAGHRLSGLETCDWASAACMESKKAGAAIVKESHKCANQPGHDTGIFTLSPEKGLESRGWGILPGEISEDFQPAWASWCIAYENTPDERELAFKSFDKFRYPVRAEDLFTGTNTWGSSEGALEQRDAASEKSVLREIESCADIGIDLVQVDDGWQGNQYKKWQPDPERYPEGWKNIAKRAQELGVKLGLWAAHHIPLEDLKRNFDLAGFIWHKLDFARLDNRQDIDQLTRKARDFILYTKHKARVNWDNTEIIPRYGFFFAREAGATFFANRKPGIPPWVVYRPHTVLRDLWDLSRYVNLAKFLGDIQNVKRCNPELTDAKICGDAYATAIALFALPTFFQQTSFYDEYQRRQIRPLLKLHRKHRETIRKGITYPIGECPDSTQWTGFQNHDKKNQCGLLLVFREQYNREPETEIKLRFADAEHIEIENLLTGKSWKQKLTCGRLGFKIEEAPGFLFLKYSLT